MTDETHANFVPHSHLPYWTEGIGFYSNNSRVSSDVVAAAQPLVLRALDCVPLENGAAFVICDYGTADGGSSFALLGACVDEIKKKHGQEREIMVYYEDQASNDFKSVINRVNELIPGPSSYVMKNSGVYTACVGTGFFSRCFPAKTVHFGISFTAMHWLSKRPCILTDALHHICSLKKEEYQQFEEQAARDWETILLARAHELVPGGQLVIACLSGDHNGQYSGKTERVKFSLYERMTTHWANMVTDGKITQEEFVNTTFNMYYRTEEEFSAPFKDPDSKVNHAGLQLLSIETRFLPCPHNSAWEASDSKGDPEADKVHAKLYMAAIRVWSNSIFRSALCSSRTEEEKDQLTNELYARYEADVASAPGDHAVDYLHAYIHIQKSAYQDFK